jgi:hypothetical protein
MGKGLFCGLWRAFGGRGVEKGGEVGRTGYSGRRTFGMGAGGRKGASKLRVFEKSELITANK